jgi:hypothetical protein
MAEVSFTYALPEKSIGGFVIDAFLSENYSFSNSLTDIPVEEGANIVDHVTEDQDKISIEAFIGNADFEVVASNGNTLAQMEPPDKGARIRRAYQELLRLKRARQPVDVVMGLDTFTNMIITLFSIDRAVETGADLPFAMEFKRIKIVKSETTQINASSPAAGGAGDQAAGTANAGTAGTSQPAENQTKEEWRMSVRAGRATPADYQRKWGVPYPQ